MKNTLTKESMLQFPIFQLIGGTAAERRACIDSIKNALLLAHLNIGVVKEDYTSRYELCILSQRFDLILVEGDVLFPLNTIHITNHRDGCHEEPGKRLVYFREINHETGSFCDELLEKLVSLIALTPVWACVLIGGKSSRMGQPKHLLQQINGEKESWIERTVRKIEPLVDGVVISGRGDVPRALSDIQRISDIPGVAGPLTGVLSAMRWYPRVSWLVVACDMPFVSGKAVDWLLSQRNPGCWGLIPRLPDTDFCEPLFAWYDARAGHLLEEQLLEGNLRVGKIAAHHKIDNPVIPDYLASAWQNVNTPEQLHLVTDK